MLVADTENDSRIPAWVATKPMQPFFCPNCGKEVILNKGRIRTHHYKHKPPVECEYGTGESEVHHHAKYEIFTALESDSTNKNVVVEHRLNGIRPDVYFEKSGAKIAIEVQKTSQTLDQIDRRTRKYHQLGIQVLWILPDPEPKWVETEDSEVCRIKTWHEYFHAMYFGRIYYWQRGAVVRAAHFEKFYREIPEGNWVEDFEEHTGEDLSGTNWYQENHYGADYGGGRRLVKSYRAVNWLSRELDLSADFRATYRKRFDCKRYTVPECRLWIDREKSWWKSN